LSVRTVLRWLLVVILLTAIGGGVAYAVSTVLPRTYRSETLLIVGGVLSAPGPSYDDLQISQNLSTVYAKLATTRPILERAIDRLDLDMTALDLVSRVEAEAGPGSLVALAVEDSDAERAAALANSIAQELIAASPELTERQERAESLIASDLRTTDDQIAFVESEIDALTAIPDRDSGDQARLERMQDRLASLLAARATLLGLSGPSTANVLTVADEAEPADSPVAPRPLLNAAAGGVAGFAIAIGIAYLVRNRHPATSPPNDGPTSPPNDGHRAGPRRRRRGRCG
jgi:succinoglycan biosynthesis transport protein ExoP